MTTLPSGLRIVTDTAPSVETLAIGVWVGVGTRHENAAENGIAHMLEHMMFKGTTTRTSKQISDLIENAGGHMNAYTGREITAYYITILNDHLDLTIDVLSDIIQNSTFPEDEIDRERAVIIQEIKMYEDSPDDLVFDYAQQNAYPGQSLGASGLGLPDVISKIGQADLKRYISTHYGADRMVISAAGDLDHDQFVAKIARAFDHLPAPNGSEGTGLVAARYTPTPALVEKDTEQVHFILGFDGIARRDPRHPTQRVLSNILGGGTSSRLWQEIREKNGLVYSIYSYLDSYQDGGLMGIYAGTGADEIAKVVPLAIDQIKSMCAHIDEDEIARAKTQIISSVRMGREKMMTRTDQQGRFVLGHGKPFDIPSFVERISAVTAQDVMQLAKDVYAKDPLISAVGPLEHLMSAEEIRARLLA